LKLQVDIAKNLAEVRGKIAKAAERAGRDPDDVTLVTVTKTRSLGEIEAAIEAGARDLGENYVQEMEEKAGALPAELRWHAIGHLQTNKVRKIAGFVNLVHSVDSLRLAREIAKRAEAAGRQVGILLQVNLSGEESKSGIEEADQVAELARDMADLAHAPLAGLMTMPPWSEDPEDNRRYFRALRELRDRLVDDAVPAEKLRHLSMGMTGDFEVAVEEGATLVRVGTAIFGPRQ
jgi:pyridoxal phosphate enzyme (YggS family)